MSAHATSQRDRDGTGGTVDEAALKERPAALARYDELMILQERRPLKKREQASLEATITLLNLSGGMAQRSIIVADPPAREE